MKAGVILNLNRNNMYSFAALIGALEMDERLTDVDFRLVRDPMKHIDKMLKQYEKVILCYSFMSSHGIYVFYEVRRLRSLYDKEVFLIGGGAHASGSPKDALKMGFDVVVVGEGEKTLPELIYRIVNGKEYEDLPGIGLRNGEKYQINKVVEKTDINLFPPFAVKHKIFAPIEISRGCPWSCKFCQTPRIFGFCMQHRSVKCVLKYTKLATKKDYKNFWFISPNSYVYGSIDGKKPNINMIKSLLRSLRKVSGIDKIFFGSFPSEVRPDSVTLEVSNLVAQYASNKTVVIGAQSGSNSLLRLSGRGHSTDEIYRAVEITRSVGLTPHLDFIFCLPRENEDDLNATKIMIKEFVRKNAKIHAHVFIPLPGTPYQYAETKTLDDKTRKWLSSLAKDKVLDGYWTQHAQIGKDILVLREMIGKSDRIDGKLDQ